MNRLFTAIVAACTFLLPQFSFADDASIWQLVNDKSKISYGSVKEGSVGEVNHFAALSGALKADGSAMVEIDLASAETWKKADAIVAPKDGATLAAVVPNGDIKKGKRVYKKCKVCHEVKKEKNKVGPHLVDLFGRRAGSIEGFKYSKAFKALDEVWGVENLTAYLTKPKAYVPGTKMAFAGLKKEADVINLLTYLHSLK